MGDKDLRMETGFIYVVASVTKDYLQPNFCNVPTEWEDRLYFGPCKKSMRPKMKADDFVFGISPSSTSPRRIVFVAQIEERLTFREAYERFPGLRGPKGPIHVKPVDRPVAFPESSYEHIPDSMHPSPLWVQDLATPDRDAFFVFRLQDGWPGRWLGADGPAVDDTVLEFLRTCEVHWKAGLLSDRNDAATIAKPIRHGNLFTGLHLETRESARLLGLFGPPALPMNSPSLPRPRPTNAAGPGRSLGCGKA